MQTENPLNKYREILILACLALVTFAVYWQVQYCAFVSFDDPVYINQNYNIQKDISFESIKWAFTTSMFSNWHPFTWLSYMLDFRIYGLNPAGYHLTNLFLHIANSLLLFVLLKDLTANLWQSAFVAALFALHPIHVESVAWVSERKDVLSAFFWLLALISYTSYVRHSDYKRYLLTLVFFTFGLLSKAMVVTLPFVLLLLDFWPLCRIKKIDKSNWKVFIEKVPFFILSLALCVATYFVQKEGGSVANYLVYPLTTRIANAFISYLLYIEKMIWPYNLIFFYPYPDTTPLTQFIGAINIFILISLFTIYYSKRLPYLIIGWLWYVGALIPVIGIVQVGSQSMADRYTYIPSIGIFIMATWGLSDIFKEFRYRHLLLTVFAGIYLSYFILGTWLQVRYWKDDIALYEHAIHVSEKNSTALNNLGLALIHKEKYEEAELRLKEVLKLIPNSYLALNNLGVRFAKEGKSDEAISYFRKSIQANPYSDIAHTNLGLQFAQHGKNDEAILHYREAIKINPDSLGAHFHFGRLLLLKGQKDLASQHFKEVKRINPYIDIDPSKPQEIPAK